ncbi:YdiK family protein [Caldibacillus lycopersici]|uniref:YdiK family protein n=1 Tax=Perspicuibacillus lycopersici TaxID=1325689 RepID=A0AAE3IVP6_9BACI|nr:YdiK family protein [Perspicuibacillus lycopersici]MCU9615322.1 YdiK family protein [Perspicuibacillus lycopersici]
MRSPLSLAIIYMILGIVFTYFAIQQVQMNGWGFFAFVLIFLATLDFGSGIRMLFLTLFQKRKK